MPNSVKTTVTELPESRVRVEAEVAPEEVERRVQQAARELGRQMRMPGFRKGKVPPPVVIRRLGREAVLDEAVRERARRAGTRTRSTAPGSRRSASRSSTWATCRRRGQPLAFSIEIGVPPDGQARRVQGPRGRPPRARGRGRAVDEELERLRDRSRDARHGRARRPRAATTW